MGSLDQAKLPAILTRAVMRGPAKRTDRDTKKLFVGKELAGSITRDASSLTIKIKTAALSGDQERRLREFVENLVRG